MPSDWFFRLHTGAHATGRELWSHPLVAVWGDEEMVTEPIHIDSLMRREHPALDVFVEHLSRAGGWDRP